MLAGWLLFGGQPAPSGRALYPLFYSPPLGLLSALFERKTCRTPLAWRPADFGGLPLMEARGRGFLGVGLFFQGVRHWLEMALPQFSAVCSGRP